MAALSLKCNTCGIFLRSMREAQDHGEATGHADFAESTEAVLTLVRRRARRRTRAHARPAKRDVHGASCVGCARLRIAQPPAPLRARAYRGAGARAADRVRLASRQECAECGKPCRSQTEQDVHTKRTGHTQFVDKTAEAAKPMVLALAARARGALTVLSVP